jgi:hypothetical protein
MLQEKLKYLSESTAVSSDALKRHLYPFEQFEYETATFEALNLPKHYLDVVFSYLEKSKSLTKIEFKCPCPFSEAQQARLKEVTDQNHVQRNTGILNAFKSSLTRWSMAVANTLGEVISPALHERKIQPM